MLINWLFVGALLAGISFATFTDLKGRWVPNFISFSLIAIGLGGHLIITILEKSLYPFFFSVVGLGAFFTFGALMYYSGIWGGGDAKLLAGIGAVLPVAPFFNPAPWPFLLTLLLNILLFGCLFGIIGSFGLALKHWKEVLVETKTLLHRFKTIVYFLLLLLPLCFAAFLFIKNTFPLFLWAILIFFFYLFIFLKSVENKSMFKRVPPTKLVEGDWVLDVYIANKKIYAQNRTGISKEEIERLVKLYKHGKIKEVIVKEGLPYVPAFLFATIVSVFYGDLLFKLFIIYLI